MKYEGVCALSDDGLVCSLDSLAKKERELTALLVCHLAVLDERGLFLELGYPSLFAYATLRLGFSDDVAYKRIRAARVVRRFPEVLADLEAETLSLSTLVVLSPKLLSGQDGAALLKRLAARPVVPVRAICR